MATAWLTPGEFVLSYDTIKAMGGQPPFSMLASCKLMPMDADSTRPVERLAYRPAELAEAIGCTRQHIYDLIAAGELQSFKLGRGRYIPASVVHALIESASRDAD